MKYYDGKSDEKIKSIDMSEAGDVNKPATETGEAVENPALEGSALKETNVQDKVDAAQKDIPSPLLTDEMDARTRQQLMVDAGLDIGQSGEKGDGVDGDFGAKSEAAWKEYTSMVEGGDYTTDANGKMVYDFSGGTGNAIVPEITDYNRRVPGLPSITKQRGGFISKLINNRRAY